MVAISLTRPAAPGVNKRTLGAVRRYDHDQARREGKTEMAMSRTDGIIVRRFATIVSHAWVTSDRRHRLANIRLNLDGSAAASAVQQGRSREYRQASNKG